MKDSLDMNFGLIIAFLLPGFILEYGLSFAYESVKDNVLFAATHDTNVGAFLFVALASLAIGLIVSAVRWLILDHLLWFFFWLVRHPFNKLNFSTLKDPDAYKAFLGVVDNHYRYYQYYSNTFVSLLAALIAYGRVGSTPLPASGYWLAGGVLLALLLGSGDSLKKYNDRASQILGTL